MHSRIRVKPKKSRVKEIKQIRKLLTFIITASTRNKNLEIEKVHAIINQQQTFRK